MLLGLSGAWCGPEGGVLDSDPRSQCLCRCRCRCRCQSADLLLVEPMSIQMDTCQAMHAATKSY